jgi:hypothetical protein
MCVELRAPSHVGEPDGSMRIHHHREDDPCTRTSASQQLEPPAGCAEHEPDERARAETEASDAEHFVAVAALDDRTQALDLHALDGVVAVDSGELETCDAHHPSRADQRRASIEPSARRASSICVRHREIGA